MALSTTNFYPLPPLTPKSPFLSFTRPGPVEPSHWFLCWMVQTTCFRPGTVLLGIWTMSDVIWGKCAQKGEWIGSFKPKRQNLYIAIYPELLIQRTSDLRIEFRPRQALRGWSAIICKSNTTWLTAAVLKIDMTSYYRAGWSDLDEIRQRDAARSRRNGWDRNRKLNSNMADVCFSKPEVVISQPWIDLSTKFGLLVDFDLLKAVTSTNTKPEIVLSGRGCHLEKNRYDVIFLQWVVRYRWYLAGWCKITCRLWYSGRLPVYRSAVRFLDCVIFFLNFVPFKFVFNITFHS